jgi:hypothetical protein
MARRQLSDAHPQQDASKNVSDELKKVCVKTAGAVVFVLTLERIADKAGQTAKDIAMISKSGSAEEQAVLDKTEKMAHAAALGSANGASEALKNRWWLLWPWEFLWGRSSSSSNSAVSEKQD